MFENKKVNIIISFIVAITLWIYVIGETNPQDQKTFREVPIKYINEQVLTESGLAVVSVSDTYMTVTVSGSRAAVNDITDKDITATVNLADATRGKNQLKVNVQSPDDVDIKDKNIGKVTVEVETRESRQVEVVPEYKGTFAEEEEPITVGVDHEMVTVTGAASQIEKVQAVKAVVKENSVTHDLKTLECPLVPTDHSGVPVKNVDLSAETVNVTAQLAKIKTVKLHVPIVDHKENTIKKSYKVPKTIVIKGKAEDLKDIDTVNTQTVDLSDLTESITLNLVPVLPEGVQVSAKSSGALKMTVEVSEVAERNFNFTEEDIKIQGLAEGFDAKLETAKIKLTAEGAKSIVEQLEEDNFSLTVNVEDMDAGSHQVQLTVTCSRKNILVSTDMAKINVTIEEK